MRSAKTVICVLSILNAWGLTTPISAQTPQPNNVIASAPKRIVIATGTLLDGKGRVLHNSRIVIEGAKIVAIDPKAGPVDYDLRGLTVLPGWIDAHVHLNFAFGKDGRNTGANDTPQETTYAVASNAWLTLMAGFTTVQNMGSNAALRDAIGAGVFPGPRILTIIDPLTGQGEKTGTPDELRAYVRKQKAAGADFIKIYAAANIPKAADPWKGGMTLSQEQLNAVCDEAKKAGLRTVVHAYRDAVQGATLAGCTEVEHGLGATDDDLRLMAQKGTYFDPQAGLLIETYYHSRTNTPARPTSQRPSRPSCRWRISCRETTS